MKYIVISVFSLCLIGIVITGLLLFTGHPGQAIRVSTFIFLGLILGIVLKYLSNE